MVAIRNLVADLVGPFNPRRQRVLRHALTDQQRAVAECEALLADQRATINAQQAILAEQQKVLANYDGDVAEMKQAQAKYAAALAALDQHNAQPLSPNEERYAAERKRAKIRMRQMLEVIPPYGATAREHWNDFSRGYYDEYEIKRFINEIEGFTLTTYDGLMEIANEVRYCELTGIKGDYVEVGAYKGGSVAMMALCNLHYGQSRRKIHAFDSFQGLPQPVASDIDLGFNSIFKVGDDKRNGALEPIEYVVADESFLQEIVFGRVKYPSQFVEIHRGWFQNTIPVADIDKIAILRLDGDLYESYMVPLKHLYDKVVPGGFVLIDDWIFKGCRDALADFFGPRGGMPYLHHSDATVRVIRKQ